MARNLKYVPSLVDYNKADLVEPGTVKGLCISAEKGEGIEELKEAVWGKLGLMRIYLKRIGKPPDMKEPMIMSSGLTVREVGEKIHKVFVEHFKHARIWGPSAQFEGQIVGMNFKLRDGDIVEFHMD
jgi:ribosome-interacting GTPase 1